MLSTISIASTSLPETMCIPEKDKITYYKLFQSEDGPIYKVHRDNDLPAIIYKNGTRKWYQNGNLHRDNNKPVIEYVEIL